MAAIDNVNPTQFYHASPALFGPGDEVTPGHGKLKGSGGDEGRTVDPEANQKTYFTDDLTAARSFRTHVYAVEPSGEYQPDLHFPAESSMNLGPGEVRGKGFGGVNGYGTAKAYESRSPLKVVSRLDKRTLPNER